MFFFGKKSDIEINRLVEKFTRFQAGLFYSIDGSNVKFYLKYKSEFFDYPFQVLDHLIILLQKAIQFLFKKIKQLSKICFLTKYDEKIWLDLNSTDLNFEFENKSLTEIFEYTVRVCNKKPALIYEDLVLTFDEMNKRVNELAHYLQKYIKCGSVVGVCFSQSFDMIIILFSILKCRGVYLPLDKNYPRERLDYMVKDSKATIIITEEKFEDFFRDNNSSTILVYEKFSELKSENDQNPKFIDSNDDPVYILYTSGSTNKPKGLKNIDHFYLYLIVLSLINRCYWVTKRIDK